MLPGAIRAIIPFIPPAFDIASDACCCAAFIRSTIPMCVSYVAYLTRAGRPRTPKSVPLDSRFSLTCESQAPVMASKWRWDAGASRLYST